MNTLSQKKRFSTREITSIAIMAALGVVLAALIHLPIIPSAGFLEYDPADIPIFITTFAFGPLAGLITTVVVSVIQGLTVSAASGWIGIVMHIAATGSFVLVAGNIYKRNKTRTRAAGSLALGVTAQVLVMVVCNMIFTPLFMGVPLESVISMIVPVLLPFNLAKAGINAAVTFALYKPLAKLMRGQARPAAIPPRAGDDKNPA